MLYVDMGVTQHMCYARESFTIYTKSESIQVLLLGDNTTYHILVYGDVSIHLFNGVIKEIPNVVHIPRLKKNLF